jgi:hypothetical protein
MARSRSSFDFDLTSAIAAAASLSTEEKNKKAPGLEPLPAGLVSFDPSQSATSEEMAQTAPAPGALGTASEGESAFGSDTSTRSPPKLPDLSSIVSPVQRCERIVQWITEATGATDVFLADAAGLPLAGSVSDTESKLAGSGLVASSIASLAAAVPGNHAPLFELHVGEGPFFQLIGFQVGTSLFIVGMNRSTPLTPRQAHAIRLACRHALGDTLRGGA